MVASSQPVYMNGSNGIKTAHLNLYAPCEAGIKYLLAQSPDTEHLVPDVQEAEWEVVGTKKDVKVVYRSLPLIELQSNILTPCQHCYMTRDSAILALCGAQMCLHALLSMVMSCTYPANIVGDMSEHDAYLIALTSKSMGISLQGVA